MFQDALEDLELLHKHHDMLINTFDALKTPISDEALKHYFDSARQSALRFDTVRCQAMLDRVNAL
ncbi:hypothetical protein LPB41_14070 [Thalassospira sp. MA62]|nr:hypothetical protein [Thalassospira sp. MA62]